MQKAEPKKWIGQGRFDRMNSTFKHIITVNSQIKNGLVDIPGYCKGLLGKESPNKIEMLEGEIMRLVKCGYLFGTTTAINKTTGLPYGDRTIQWKFFINGNYTGEPDELLFTLYPDRYEFAQNQDFLLDVRFNTFLKRLYEQAKEGKFVTKSLIHKPKITNHFDITKKRFKNHKELLDYIEIKKREGYAEGEVFDFYVKYSQKWLSNDR